MVLSPGEYEALRPDLILHSSHRVQSDMALAWFPRRSDARSASHRLPCDCARPATSRQVTAHAVTLGLIVLWRRPRLHGRAHVPPARDAKRPRRASARRAEREGFEPSTSLTTRNGDREGASRREQQRQEYRIPLAALLKSLGGNYDLAAELRSLDAAALEAGTTDEDVLAALDEDDSHTG